MIALTFDAAALDQINRVLEQLPGLMQSAAFEGGLRPAGEVVAKRMRQLTPRSSSSGATKKWSKKTAQSRAGESPLADNIGVKVLRPKNRTASVLIGFQWPGGNKGHFVSPMKRVDREQVLWGKRTGKRVAKANDFQRQAFDETKSQQASAFISGMRKKVDSKIASAVRSRR